MYPANISVNFFLNMNTVGFSSDSIIIEILRLNHNTFD